MGSYRIFHKLSDDNRITTCNNDIELIQFVNRIQTENEDPHTYDVAECVKYINTTCNNLEFVSEDFDGTKEFEFYMDQKHTIWYRGYFKVKSSTYDEAVKKVSQMFRENTLQADWWDILDDTTEEMTVEENGGFATLELFTESGDLVLQNGE